MHFNHENFNKVYLWVHIFFSNFATELQPRLTSEFKNPLSILRINEQNLTFCMHIITDKICAGNVLQNCLKNIYPHGRTYSVLSI